MHTDAKTIATHGPGEEYRAPWSDYPDDIALIRFKSQRLEVMGKGVKPNEKFWQPQGLAFPHKA